MDYFLRFAAPIFLLTGAGLLALGFLLRIKMKKFPEYVYPLTGMLQREGMTSRHSYRMVLAFLRFIILLLLVLLVGKPQFVDMRTKAMVRGINIILVLDVSGSMQASDYGGKEREGQSRFDIAKEEAIRFVRTRTNDAIGLVLFGKDALSRCPLTHDKKMLAQIIEETQLGIINPDGTFLAKGIISAANRLRHSTAKTNIIIALTDGRPTEGDADPKVATKIAKELGIKIYTIGIGSDEDQPVMHPIFGVVGYMPGVDRELLARIATSTGGAFFLARDAQDMRNVYEIIDKLEKTEFEAPLYTKYHDIFMPFLWVIFALISIELLVTATIWFGL